MPSCLVVGGGGFIGGHLVRTLLERNNRKITVVGRSATPRCNLPGGVNYVQLAQDNPSETLRRVMVGVDEIVDLAHATVPKTSFDDPVQDVLQNLPFTVSLIKLAAERKLRQFVFVSSGGTVYGNPHSLPIDESHPTNPVSPYGITKLAAEKYGLMYHALEGLPFTVARPGNPYGPNQLGKVGQGFVATVLTAALEGNPVRIFGECGTTRDYIFIDDLVRGIRDVLDYGDPGAVYNIGSGQGMDNQQVIQVIQRCIASDSLNLSVIHEAARPFDVAANVLNSGRLYYKTGWRPEVGFAEGIERTWRWYKSSFG